MARVAMRKPDATERTAIATEAAKGSDAALAAKDRRSRAQISSRTSIAPGTSVYVGQDEYTLLGPGRGDGWALLAWVDEEGNRCFGTFHESQFTTVQPQVRDGLR